MNGGMSQLLYLDVETSLGDLLNSSWLELFSMSSVGISSNWCMILNIVIALTLVLHWAKDGQFKFFSMLVTLAYEE